MADKNLLDTAKGKEVNPMLIVPVVVVVILILGYLLWWKPKAEADAALANFNTPEAQAKRDPDKKKVSASLQEKINEMRSKEKHANTGGSAHRQDGE